MATNNERKSNFNPNRGSYLSLDGTYYVYRRWDEDEKKEVEVRLEVGKDGVTLDWLRFLDEDDYAMDVGDDREDRHKDSDFEEQKEAFDKGEVKHDPMGQLADMPSAADEHPDAAKIRAVVDTQLTESQQELYYKHFGMNQQLEQIRRDEAAESGQEKSLQSVLNRKNKIIRKVAKQAFNAEPVKRSNYPKKK